jgi:hypothetical protein
MSHDFNVPPTQPSAAKDRANLILAVCLFWVLASAFGFAVQVFAAPASALRGSHLGEPTPSVQTKAPVSRANTSPPKSKRATAVSLPSSPQAWLGATVWRAGPCETTLNFQTFSFTNQPKVEVGSGKPGDGEKLELLRVATIEPALIQIETRVCAPVGCNQTIERYKIINANQMQEWHFEGRLPDHVPYVIVANGAALDGSGAGRIFNRCAA